MGYVVRMPKLGLEMEQGTLLEWAVDVGESVAEGDLIAEIESEKSIGEVDAREDGVLRETYLSVGDAVPPGTPIGIVAPAEADIASLEAEAEADLAGDAAAGATDETGTDDAGEPGETDTVSADGADDADAGAATTDVKASPRARKRAEELGVDLSAVDGTGPQNSITEDDVEAATGSDEDGESGRDEVKASPRARKRAEELGVDLSTVDGTGPQNSITEGDVEAAAEDAQAARDTGPVTEAGRAEPAAEAAGGVTRTPPSTVDRYARETAVLDADAAESLLDAATAAREAIDEDASVTDVMVLVATDALASCPRCNATFADATHQLRSETHVAVVVGDDEGAVAGTVRVDDADAASLRAVVERRTAGPDGEGADGGDTPDPTFTLSNASSFAAGSTAGRVINPPAVAALEFDPVGQRATPGDDGVGFEPLVTLAVTYDTRALDADDARAFLDAVAAAADRAPALVTESFLSGA